MAIAQTQKKTGTAVTAASYDIIFTSTPTQNNLMVGMWGLFLPSQDVGVISAPTGWTAYTGFPYKSVAGDLGLLIGYKVAGAGESTTVTATSDNAGDHWQGTIFEYSGLTTSGLEDVSSTATSGVSTVTSLSTGTTGATAVANELVIAGWSLFSNSGGTESVTNGFTIEDTSGDSAIVASKILSATGTVETTASWLTARKAIAGLATFKTAAVATLRPTPIVSKYAVTRAGSW